MGATKLPLTSERSTEVYLMAKLDSPVIVLILEFLETDQIIGQYAAITRWKALVVRGLPNGIDHIVEHAIIPPALIQIRLHFG